MNTAIKRTIKVKPTSKKQRTNDASTIYKLVEFGNNENNICPIVCSITGKETDMNIPKSIIIKAVRNKKLKKDNNTANKILENNNISYDISETATTTATSIATTTTTEYNIRNNMNEIINEENQCGSTNQKLVKNNKTQKRKITKKDKLHMWDSFHKDIIDITHDTSENGNDAPIVMKPTTSSSSSSRNTKKERDNCSSDATVSTLEEIDENPNHQCTLCSSPLIIMDDGFPTCSNPSCGVMNRDILDYSPEWRFYGADDKNANDPTRCGNPINPLLVESSFGCKLICSSRSSYEMKRIRQWVEWTAMPHKEKSMYEEFQFISVMARNSGIPKIFIDDAMVIHKDISSQKMFRGLNRDGIKSASIYISCRLNGSPRTPQEIATIFHLDKDSASKGCSMAVNILNNIYRNNEPTQKSELCDTKPSLFIERFCSKLNINTELTMLSKFIAKKIEENDIICDNTPHSIAAGIIYFINVHGHLNLSKTQIKHICGVSEVTIGKCFKKLEAIKDQLLPKCIMEKYAKNE